MSTYHHGNLRSALVEAGIALLEQGNNADFSLREAARAVGVTVNASYRHFSNKDELMCAIAAEGFRRFSLALLKGAGTGKDARKRLLGSGRAYVQFARQHPALFRLMFSRFSAGQKGEELSEAAQLAYHPLKSAMATLLQQDINSSAVALASIRAWSAAHGLAFLILDGQISDPPGGIDALIDTVLSDWHSPAITAPTQ
ncbi:MAG: WHG domain-containing protein [Alcanivoracaceae bacterium]|nr:WHG domain-containing protein [Alcanivoracaceae bacterium]